MLKKLTAAQLAARPDYVMVLQGLVRRHRESPGRFW